MKRSTTERGYGFEHQQARAAWRSEVEAGGVVCWRCGRLIAPGARWDLGHDDVDRSVYRGPEHVRCNRSSAARRGARARNAQRRVFSRVW